MESIALANLKKHINKIHPEVIPAEPSIQKQVAKKQDKKKGAASMSMVKCIKPSLNQYRLDITRWFYLNGIPFNVLTPPGFRAIHEKNY